MGICNDKYNSKVTKPQKEGIAAEYRVIDDIDCGEDAEPCDGKETLAFPEIVCKIAGKTSKKSGITCQVLMRKA